MAPSVQRHKVWLTPTTIVPCSNAAKTPNPLKFAGVPQTTKQSQPLVGRSSPYYGDIWRRYCCLTKFFRIVDTCFDTVGWVIWPAKTVPEMTYNVFSGTLNPTHFTKRRYMPYLRRYSPTKLCDGAQMAVLASFASCICSELRAAHFRPAF